MYWFAWAAETGIVTGSGGSVSPLLRHTWTRNMKQDEKVGRQFYLAVECTFSKGAGGLRGQDQPYLPEYLFVL